MNLRHRLKEPAVMIRIGLLSFVLANISLRFLHRALHLPEDAADLTAGVFFGVAIGLMLLGIWLNAHRRPGCS
jgi:hypothetical protein